MPLITTPAGFIRIAHPDGELGVARAAEAAGTAVGIGILASYPIEAITREASNVWFQLYMIGGREGSVIAMERARAAGCEVLIITVDFASLSGGQDYQRGHPGRARPRRPPHCPQVRPRDGDAAPVGAQLPQGRS